MTGRYKAYPEYKNSGVEWLKEIPIHWDCKKLKFFLNDLVRGPFGSALKKEFFTTAGIKVYEQKNCIQNNVALGESYISEDTYRDLIRFAVTNGDLLMSCSGTIGKIVEVTEPYEKGIINQALLIMRINGSVVNKAFFKHIFRSEDVQKQIKDNTQGGAMQNLVATDIFKSVSFTVPSYEEQQKIANFLDHETAKIDTLIDKQEKLIELLKEKRQAVISHAVTKGLNPDAPMKDSGVEWLGDVPEHWEVLPTKRFFRLVAEPSTKNHGKELLSVYAAIGVAPRKDLEQKGNKASNTDGYWSVKKGDIIVNKLLAWMGAVGYSDYDGVTSPAYDILRKTKDINPKFYHFLFRQEFTQSEFKRWSRGIMEMRLRLYFEELGRIMMPVPPKNEQDKIVAEIESMNATFVKIEDKATKQIELMKERKTALISAAVTGKIDVRDWQESA
ncbi:restriction endonuclease subunit S [Vibrio diabolicus]|uniref:restriction endonuclease subunit S n=1 Tax=Vibrio diabolicus TaxID=50719 RepID=UPI003F868684